MTAIAQFKVSWAGAGVVGLAFTTTYAQTTGGQIAQHSNALQTFFNAIKGQIPASVTIQVPSSGQIYDDVTGQLLGTWSGPAQAAIVGTGAGAFGSPLGAVVAFQTGVILRRHLLVGRIYLVPLVGSTFNANGVIAPANLTILNNAVNALVSVGTLRIWSRPRGAGNNGGSGLVVAGTTRQYGAVLRSRRQ